MRHTLKLYSPHAAQQAFHDSLNRYRVFVAGRQVGKSSACLNELLKHAWCKPGSVYWYLSPTYAQAKIQYRRMVGMLWPCREVMTKKSQTEHRVKLVNQSEIVFKSADLYQNLRGATLNGAVLDEVREMPPEVWSMVIQPMLATTQGWAAFVSTPNGYDFFYDLAERARADTTGTWGLYHAPSTANPLFSMAEYERLKREMPQAQFEQEIEALFRDLTAGKAYITFTQANLCDHNPLALPGAPLNPWLPVVVACDFNLSPMAWTLGQERAGSWHWLSEIWLKGSHTQEAAQELVARLKGWIAAGYMRNHPQVVVAGDSSSNAGQRAAAGKSDYDILLGALREAGISYDNRTPASNPHVKDRVNTVCGLLRSADGTVRLTVDPKGCPMLTRDLQRVVWKPNSTVLDQTSNPELTHASDGIGYACCAITPMAGVNDVGTLRVLRR